MTMSCWAARPWWRSSRASTSSSRSSRRELERPSGPPCTTTRPWPRSSSTVISCPPACDDAGREVALAVAQGRVALQEGGEAEHALQRVDHLAGHVVDVPLGREPGGALARLQRPLPVGGPVVGADHQGQRRVVAERSPAHHHGDVAGALVGLDGLHHRAQPHHVLEQRDRQRDDVGPQPDEVLHDAGVVDGARGAEDLPPAALQEVDDHVEAHRVQLVADDAGVDGAPVLGDALAPAPQQRHHPLRQRRGVVLLRDRHVVVLPASSELGLGRAEDAQQHVVGRQPRRDDHVDGLVVGPRERQVEVLLGQVAEGGVGPVPVRRLGGEPVEGGLEVGRGGYGDVLAEPLLDDRAGHLGQPPQVEVGGDHLQAPPLPVQLVGQALGLAQRQRGREVVDEERDGLAQLGRQGHAETCADGVAEGG